MSAHLIKNNIFFLKSNLAYFPFIQRPLGSGKLKSVLVHCQSNLTIVLYALSLHFVLAYHEHNSLPLGQIRAFISFYKRGLCLKSLHSNRRHGR